MVRTYEIAGTHWVEGEAAHGWEAITADFLRDVAKNTRLPVAFKLGVEGDDPNVGQIVKLDVLLLPNGHLSLLAEIEGTWPAEGVPMSDCHPCGVFSLNDKTLVYCGAGAPPNGAMLGALKSVDQEPVDDGAEIDQEQLARTREALGWVPGAES